MSGIEITVNGESYLTHLAAVQRVLSHQLKKDFLIMKGD